MRRNKLDGEFVVVIMTALVLVSMGIAWLITQPTAIAQNPVFHSNARIVEVAVVARDSQDIPVSDLKIDEFHVFDNGAEQTIQSLDKLWYAPRTADGLPVGLPPKRRSIILLDALHTTRGHQLYGRQAVSEMLKRIPQTTDTIAVFALGVELRILHDFTPFTFGLRAAVDAYTGEEPTVPAAERLHWTMKALTEIAQQMKRIPGEKNLIWVTDGFVVASVYDEAARAMRELAAARVMLYPVDARGLSLSAKAFEGIGGLRDLAELTGGRAYFDSNGLADLLVAAIDDSREGYLLTYAPNNYTEDGSVHEVKLRTDRRGIELRYRPAYSADPSTK